MSILEAIVLAIVEGLTEFLPVSSTGHMIIASWLMGIAHKDFTKLFTVNIQLGAILAVVVYYWKQFFKNLTFYYKLLVAFIPGAIIGFLLNDFIDSLLENVTVVAIMLIVGGIILVKIDQWLEKTSLKGAEVTYSSALKIGFFQCIAMVPGVSRSAATIIGGMLQGLTRQKAAEFSFFLAVPTMFAATAYKLLKSYKSITPSDIEPLLIGNLVAFVVALAAIKYFVAFLTKYGFKVFGYYRIALGLLLLLALQLGYSLQIV
jgi:undecaprenyl-diphosphatase